MPLGLRAIPAADWTPVAILVHPLNRFAPAFQMHCRSGVTPDSEMYRSFVRSTATPTGALSEWTQVWGGE